MNHVDVTKPVRVRKWATSGYRAIALLAYLLLLFALLAGLASQDGGSWPSVEGLPLFFVVMVVVLGFLRGVRYLLSRWTGALLPDPETGRARWRPMVETGRRERRGRYGSVLEARRLGPRVLARAVSTTFVALIVGIALIVATYIPGLGAIVATRALGPRAIEFYRRARTQGQRRAEEELRRDTRPQVLFLRAFADDTSAHLFIKVRRSARRHWMENWLLRYEHLEEVIARILWRFGPVVTVGRPGDVELPLGAVRTYVAGEDWQTVVRQLMEEAALMVVVVGRGEGLAWEIEQLAEGDHLANTLFVFPPGHEEVLEAWDRVARIVVSQERQPPAVSQDGGSPLVLSLAAPEPVGVYGRRQDEWNYEVGLDVVADLAGRWVDHVSRRQSDHGAWRSRRLRFRPPS